MENRSRSPQPCEPFIPSTATLFDTLPSDALSVIVKHMCWLLYKKEWGATRISLQLPAGEPLASDPDMNAPLRFLALLFVGNSPFRAAAAATFVSKVEVLWPRPRTSVIYSGARVLRIGPDLFEGEAKAMGLGRMIFSACGPRVRGISMSNAPRGGGNSKDFMDQFMAHVFQYCRNVEEIAINSYRAPLTTWGSASAFFREYDANLRKINWTGEEDVTGFPDLQQCVNLRCLKTRNLTTGTLVSLLKACGPTLEELDISITSVGDSAEVVEAIRNYCRRLSVVSIGNVEDVVEMIGQESYSALICSFGPQLKNASVAGLGHTQLAEVVNACTNLQATVYSVSQPSMDWQQVSTLGPRIAGLFLDAKRLKGDYSAALEQCSNLRELDLSVVSVALDLRITDEMVANVFSKSRFPKLEDLCVGYFNPTERNIRLIASCTGCLKSTSFGPFASDAEASVFQIIVDTQRQLLAIEMDLYSFRERSAESGLESLRQFVGIFRKCRSLLFELPCSDDENLKEEDLVRIFRILPCRGVTVHVQMGDFEYSNPT